MNERFLLASNLAAISMLPPSPTAERNFLFTLGQDLGIVSIVTSCISPGWRECNLPVANC